MSYLKTEKPEGRRRNRPLKDYTGQRFGRLIAVRLVERDPKWNAHKWLFKCDCGNEKVASIKDARTGHTSSCGCLHAEGLAARNATHGMSDRPEYKAWKDMRARCANPRRGDYKDYGGRGVSVCAQWAEFDVFLRDMGPRPVGRTIDRIDVNGNYEPANCRWALPKTQANNKRSNRIITIDGVTQTLQAWCEHYGVEPSKARWRLAQGWPIERVFSGTDYRK